METNNVNQNVKELADDQLKKVSGGGGGLCPTIDHCKNQTQSEPCECLEWEDGWGPNGPTGGLPGAGGLPGDSGLPGAAAGVV